LDMLQLQLDGCPLAAHSVREQLRSWWLDVTFLENACTIHLPAGAARDAGGNRNAQSNSLVIQWDGHNVRPGMTIAGEFVYWGQTVCLAPSSFTPISGPCPLDDTTFQEGGSFRPNCDYRVLPMSYVERDDGPDAVATRPFAHLNRTYQYANIVEYDGEHTVSFQEWPFLEHFDSCVLVFVPS
jgi:hypothetical protein